MYLATLLERLMSRLCFFGTTFIAVTSGLAAANVIAEHFSGKTLLEKQQSLSEKEILLFDMEQSLANLKEKIARARIDKSPYESSGFMSGLVKRIGSTFSMSNLDALVEELGEKEEKAQKLRKEIEGLATIQVRTRYQTFS